MGLGLTVASRDTLELLQYLTKSSLSVNVVHLARSNADEDEELYDHVCLETTSRKVADNQYRLSYEYKGIQGL